MTEAERDFLDAAMEKHRAYLWTIRGDPPDLAEAHRIGDRYLNAIQRVYAERGVETFGDSSTN